MASINKKSKQTKYTFKGKNNVDNKYANIYQDLNDKHSIYEGNMLRKMHKSPDGVEVELPADKKAVVKTVSAEEAEKNAQSRKRAIRNESLLASEKSSPVISKKDSPYFDKDKSIEMLKREKLEARLRDYNRTHDEKLDIEAIDSILDETDGVSLYEKLRALDKGDMFIHEKAKERATMDKSGVEIYKEYSDFDRPIFNKIEKDEFDDISIPDDLGRTKRVRDFSDNGTDGIKSRESEIEELIRLMKRDSDNIDRKARRELGNSKTKNIEDERENSIPKRDYVSRSEVYRRGNGRSSSGYNAKKIAGFAVVLVLLLFFLAAIIDKVNSDKKPEPVTKTKVETKTNKNSTKSVTEADKIKKA